MTLIYYVIGINVVMIGCWFKLAQYGQKNIETMNTDLFVLAGSGGH